MCSYPVFVFVEHDRVLIDTCVHAHECIRDLDVIMYLCIPYSGLFSWGANFRYFMVSLRHIWAMHEWVLCMEVTISHWLEG